MGLRRFRALPVVIALSILVPGLLVLALVTGLGEALTGRSNLFVVAPPDAPLWVLVDGADAGAVAAGQQRRFELAPGARTVQLSNGPAQVVQARRDVDVILGPSGGPCFAVFTASQSDAPRVHARVDAGVVLEVPRGTDVAWPAHHRLPSAERVVVPMACGELSAPDTVLLERLPPPRKDR